MIRSSFVILILIIMCSCRSSDEKQSRVDRLPYYNEATFTPLWLADTDTRLDTLHQIFPFQLYNQDGDTITEKTFTGKVYVADFFFTTCPGICPKMTANMGLLQQEFLDNDELLLLSHSVTPRYDSVDILKQYAESKGVISDKWHLVTGEQQEIYTLGRKAYFVEEDLGIEKDIDEFLHTENFVLVDKNRHIRGIYNGLNRTSLKQLVADVKLLLQQR